MQLSSIVRLISEHNLISELSERSKREERLLLTGTSRISNSLISSALAQYNNSLLLIIVPSFEEAGRWYSTLELMGWDTNNIYPTTESSPFYNNNTSNEIIWGQLQVLSELINRTSSSSQCIIATERSLQPHLPPSDLLAEFSINIRKGIEIKLEDLSHKLSYIGYQRKNCVDLEGSWARRGDIIDIYPVNSELPVRLEFFGEKLEKLKEFDPYSQRSQDTINNILITPNGFKSLICERLKQFGEDKLKKFINNEIVDQILQGETPDNVSNLINLAWEKPSSLIDYLPENTFLVIDEKSQCIAHGNNWLDHVKKEKPSEILTQCKTKINELNFYTKIENVFENLNKFNGFELTGLTTLKDKNNIHNISNKNVLSLPNQFGKLSEIIKSHQKNKETIFLLSAQPSRTVALLEEHECIASVVSKLDDYELINSLKSDHIPVALKCNTDAQIEGVYLPTFKLLILTDKEFFGQQSFINNAYVRRRKKSSSSKLDPNKLHPGDYVVHKNHGIGLFKKIEKISIVGEIRDYIVVKYLDGTLRVAADQLSSLGRYRSSSDKKPSINKLGGSSWQNTKQKVKKNINKVAIDLIKLYAERDSKRGYAYPSDGPWQNELEDSFPYEPTKDQLSAVVDVKNDMEKEKPMDRLICGDVGFGKTEVAIRAIFKAITSGKQIALLAPTTILAQQHWRTISERFAPYPIKVSLLNRFKTLSERKIIINHLKDGTIDAVVGTHQLLNKKTIFKNLGLLVIDEEQRFGVNQKEKIKELKKSVDVLTLSATPIPRTLYMSLSGVREMSLITTPPPLRRSIKTNLSKMDNEVIRSAICQEIDRGGQIFYVVPRVEGIEEIAIKIRKMLPNLKMIVAHGQMSEGELENSMVAFNAGEADLMLCTTIIESGLDIPRVNTIIIEDSHKFGLSQLYQLRGRVGRSGIQAYAWLFYPEQIKLTDNAKQRLKAIQEFSVLGSGYQLSMRDMEIRGVGNLLGVEQSGQMEVIGFDLYMEMLQEALAEIKGQKIPKVDDAQIDLKITAFIPGDYILDSEEKIAAYRSASNCQSIKELLELVTYWVDRYGILPQAVETLIEIMKLKIKAKNCGISRISMKKPNIILETIMDEPAFRLLRKGLPTHLHGRLIFKKEKEKSVIIARGLGLLDNQKQILELSNWLEMMEKQVNNIQ